MKLFPEIILGALLVLIGTQALTGCTTEEPPMFNCDIPPALPPREAEPPQSLAPKVAMLYPALRFLWKKPEIAVCWEQEAIDHTKAGDRALVKNAATQTWEAALAEVDLPPEQKFHFVWWGSCADDELLAKTAIRIQVEDVQPYTLGLGTHLAGRPAGMVLNFAFENWGDACSKYDDRARTNCIYRIAVHEFGHALGLAHEQNRGDTPTTCSEPTQGVSGDYYIGQWDQKSTMNYCNPRWLNGGDLSSTDASGIRTLYYPALAAEYCQQQ